MQSYVRPPSLNGHHGSPPASGEAFAAARERTVFPHEQILLAPATLLYAWRRRRFAGVPVIRLPQWLLLAGGVIWGIGLLPGRWWGAGLCLLLLLALQGTLWWLRRHDYVHFTPDDALPPVQPQPLDATAKIPLFVTGLFGVERKERRFTWLPGFYRTFATREHALLCQANNHPTGFGDSPPEEEGLWYIFFTPPTIELVQAGALTFGRNQRPALAIHYRHTPVRQQEKQSSTTRSETVYLAFQQAKDRERVLADLLVDLPLTAENRQPAEDYTPLPRKR